MNVKRIDDETNPLLAKIAQQLMSQLDDALTQANSKDGAPTLLYAQGFVMGVTRAWIHKQIMVAYAELCENSSGVEGEDFDGQLAEQFHKQLAQQFDITADEVKKIVRLDPSLYPNRDG